MKVIWGKNNLHPKLSNTGCKILNCEDLLLVRGGDRKIKPKTKPKDFFDDEEFEGEQTAQIAILSVSLFPTKSKSGKKEKNK